MLTNSPSRTSSARRSSSLRVSSGSFSPSGAGGLISIRDSAGCRIIVWSAIRISKVPGRSTTQTPSAPPRKPPGFSTPAEHAALLLARCARSCGACGSGVRRETRPLSFPPCRMDEPSDSLRLDAPGSCYSGQPPPPQPIARRRRSLAVAHVGAHPSHARFSRARHGYWMVADAQRVVSPPTFQKHFLYLT